jgi:hypothetical protein
VRSSSLCAAAGQTHQKFLNNRKRDPNFYLRLENRIQNFISRSPFFVVQISDARTMKYSNLFSPRFLIDCIQCATKRAALCVLVPWQRADNASLQGERIKKMNTPLSLLNKKETWPP